MAVQSKVKVRTSNHALRSAILGAGAVLVVPLLSPGIAANHQAAVLLGAWLCIGSLIQWLAIRGRPQLSRPLDASGGTGRFRLRVRGDGRHAVVRRGLSTVAEVRATRTGGGRLVVNADRVAESELTPLGAAIGQAIEPVAPTPKGPVRHVVTHAKQRRAGRGAYRPLVRMTRQEFAERTR